MSSIGLDLVRRHKLEIYQRLYRFHDVPTLIIGDERSVSDGVGNRWNVIVIVAIGDRSFGSFFFLKPRLPQKVINGEGVFFVRVCVVRGVDGDGAPQPFGEPILRARLQKKTIQQKTQSKTR